MLLRLLCVAITLLAATAHAIDSKATAMALARQAAQAYQAGDHAKAARSYREAYRVDPSSPDFLYGAARAEQGAGQDEHAAQDFEQFLALPGIDGGRAAKAKTYLAEIRAGQAEAKAQEAERATQKGDHAMAAELNLEAARLAPSRPQYLLRAAWAYREEGDSGKFVALLMEFLQQAPADAPERGTARAALQKQTELAAKTSPAPVAAATAAAAPPVSASPAEAAIVHAAAPSNAAAWATALGGAVVAMVGGGVYAWGRSQETQLNSDLGYDGSAVHTDVSYPDAKARADTIGSHQTLGAVTAWIGLAASGVGVWLAVRTSAPVALASTHDGAMLTWRF